jgi:hypothetical protein
VNPYFRPPRWLRVTAFYGGASLLLVTTAALVVLAITADEVIGTVIYASAAVTYLVAGAQRLRQGRSWRHEPEPGAVATDDDASR